MQKSAQVPFALWKIKWGSEYNTSLLNRFYGGYIFQNPVVDLRSKSGVPGIKKWGAEYRKWGAEYRKWGAGYKIVGHRVRKSGVSGMPI